MASNWAFVFVLASITGGFCSVHLTAGEEKTGGSWGDSYCPDRCIKACNPCNNTVKTCPGKTCTVSNSSYSTPPAPKNCTCVQECKCAVLTKDDLYNVRFCSDVSVLIAPALDCPIPDVFNSGVCPVSQTVCCKDLVSIYEKSNELISDFENAPGSPRITNACPEVGVALIYYVSLIGVELANRCCYPGTNYPCSPYTYCYFG